MKHRKWLLVLLCCMLCSTAKAESRYDQLCNQYGLRSPDVIAWLEVPGASILEPVMRHFSDDAYYAAHDANGKTDSCGSVYVQQKYNAADLADPVTLIYGSSESEEAPFGMLQESYSGKFEQCKKIYLHLPQRTSEYVVFAALPYSPIHILHYYDFGVEKRYNSFFDGVFSTRALGMHLDEENRPEFGKGCVCILSTRLRGDPLQRYLVMAREQIP